MTEAEQKLLDVTLSVINADAHGPIVDAARAVLLERLTAEFRQNYRSLAFRAWDAAEAFDEYAGKVPSSSALLYRETRDAWKKERGIK